MTRRGKKTKRFLVLLMACAAALSLCRLSMAADISVQADSADVVISEGAGGWIREPDGTGYPWYSPDAAPDLTYTVTYREDNERKTFSGTAAELKVRFGQTVQWNTEQTAEPWEAGKSYSVTASFMGAVSPAFRVTIREADRIALSAENFPDENLRSYLAGAYDPGDTGMIARDAVKYLDCGDRGIRSAKGLELLTELREITLSGNPIGSVDLSHNSELTYLDLENAGLTELDVSCNTMLTELYCGENSLEKLDVSGCTELVWLCCDGCGGLKEVRLNSGQITVSAAGCPDVRLLQGDEVKRLIRGSVALPASCGDDLQIVLRDRNGRQLAAVCTTLREYALYSGGAEAMEFTMEGYVPHSYRTVPDIPVVLARRGDVNGKGTIDAVDMQSLFEYLSVAAVPDAMKGDIAYFRDVADVNGDRAVNILDYQALYERIN